VRAMRTVVLLACVLAAFANVDQRLNELQKALKNHGADSPQAMTAVRLFKEEKAKEKMVVASSTEKPEMVIDAKHTTTLAANVDEDPLSALQKVLDKYGAESAAAATAIKRYQEKTKHMKAQSLPRGATTLAAAAGATATNGKLAELTKALAKYGADSPQAMTALKQYKQARATTVAAQSVSSPEH